MPSDELDKSSKTQIPGAKSDNGNIQKTKVVPRSSKPGTFGKRTKPAVDMDSLSMYMLKNTTLRPASSYAKPSKKSNDNPLVDRNIISAPTNTADSVPNKSTRPNITQVKGTSNTIVRRPFDPKNDSIEISKIRDRIYKKQFLESNNKLQLIVAESIAKERLEENPAVPSTSSVDNQQNLVSQPLKTFESNSMVSKDSKNKTAKKESSGKNLPLKKKPRVASEKNDESKDKRKMRKNVIYSSESENDGMEVDLPAAASEVIRKRGRPRKTSLSVPAEKPKTKRNKSKPNFPITSIWEAVTRKRGRPRKTTQPVPVSNNRNSSKSTEKKDNPRKSKNPAKETSSTDSVTDDSASESNPNENSTGEIAFLNFERFFINSTLSFSDQTASGENHDHGLGLLRPRRSVHLFPINYNQDVNFEDDYDEEDLVIVPKRKSSEVCH